MNTPATNPRQPVPKTPLILQARRAEFLPYLSQRPGFERRSEAGIDFFRLSFDNFYTRVFEIGSSPEEINRRLNSLPLDWLKDPVLFLGTAGALTDRLKIYSLFLAEKIIGGKVNSPLRINNEAVIHRDCLQKFTPDFNAATLFTSSTPLLEREKRRQAQQEQQAQAVDLEAAHLCIALRNRQPDISFGCLKIISDKLDDSQYSTVLAQQKPALKKMWDFILNSPELFRH